MAETNLLISGRTQHSEPAPADGSVVPLSINSDGRVRVASKPGQFATMSGSLTAVGNQLAVDVTDASNVMLHVKNTGTVTLAAGSFVFEGSVDSTDGLNGTWFGLQAVRSNANTIETTAALSGMGVGAGFGAAWELSVNAVKWFRIRCTVAVTTSAIATWTAIRGSYATEPIPAIQSHGVSGTVTITPTAGTEYALTTAASTNAAVIKNSAGILTEITVFNSTAATIYVRLYNKSSAPTVGTDVPRVVIPVAAGAFFAVPFGPVGKRFAAGLGIAVTAAAANNDATAVGAGALINATYI